MNKCSIMVVKKGNTNAKELIFKTALKLFSKNGLEGTSIRMIAAEAEVSPALFYNYFPSKDELLQNLFESGFENIRSQVLKKEAGSKKLKMNEKSLIILEVLEKHASFWRLYIALRHQENVQKLLKPIFNNFRDWFHDHIKAHLKDSGFDSAKTLSLALISGIEGYMVMGLMDKNNFSNKSAELIINKILA